MNEVDDVDWSSSSSVISSHLHTIIIDRCHLKCMCRSFLADSVIFFFTNMANFYLSFYLLRWWSVTNYNWRIIEIDFAWRFLLKFACWLGDVACNNSELVVNLPREIFFPKNAKSRNVPYDTKILGRLLDTDSVHAKCQVTFEHDDDLER